MNRGEIDKLCRDLGHNVLLADGFDDAFIGFVERQTQGTVALYDKLKCLRVLLEKGEMDLAEAQEYLEFNVYCAWAG